MAYKNNDHAHADIHGEIMFEVFTVRQAWRKKIKRFYTL